MHAAAWVALLWNESIPCRQRLAHERLAKISSRALVPAYLILALGLATTGLATWLTTRDVVEAGSVEFESLTDRIARNFARP